MVAQLLIEESQQSSGCNGRTDDSRNVWSHGVHEKEVVAVGGAVGHNPISLMIPCHRVVGTSGSLTGYGGGIARKVKLLELEHADMRGLFVPKTGTTL